jgi:hypothetical protein
MIMSKKIMSIDAETNGLWGNAFAIAAILADGEGEILDSFIGRCPIDGSVNNWVAENVLPQIESIPITHKSYQEMLKGFCEFYLAHKDGAQVIVHMGLPVESRLFLDAHQMEMIGDWDAPFPLVDISAIPEISTSVDSYCTLHNISTDPATLQGGTHNPLFDAHQALNAWVHYNNNKT